MSFRMQAKTARKKSAYKMFQADFSEKKFSLFYFKNWDHSTDIKGRKVSGHF